VHIVNPHGESTTAAIQRFESRIQRAAAGVGVGIVQVPEECDAGGFEQGWGEEVVDYGFDGAGVGGVFGGAEDDPG
jgi:hypothetical protein